MSVVLVVVDAADGSVPKPTLELLTLARRIGEPAAVVFGPSAALAVEQGWQVAKIRDGQIQKRSTDDSVLHKSSG